MKETNRSHKHSPQTFWGFSTRINRRVHQNKDRHPCSGFQTISAEFKRIVPQGPVYLMHCGSPSTMHQAIRKKEEAPGRRRLVTFAMAVLNRTSSVMWKSTSKADTKSNRPSRPCIYFGSVISSSRISVSGYSFCRFLTATAVRSEPTTFRTPTDFHIFSQKPVPDPTSRTDTFCKFSGSLPTCLKKTRLLTR